MPSYRIDVRIYGTLYINARDEAHARELAESSRHTEVFIGGGEFPVDCSDPSDPVAISEAATCHGPDEGTELELVDKE